MENENNLRGIIETVDAVNALAAPLVRSLENLLELAAAAVDSDEASIIVREDASENLYFLAACGKVADKLRGVRIPAGRGIASFVFSAGQPIAVADARADENFYDEVDRQTGYSTEILLATPIRFDGEIIGVLEFVNRIGEPPFQPFTAEEMDKAAVYADAIATLVDAHESAVLIGKLCRKIEDKADLREWLKRVRTAPQHREILELALLVREIAGRGEIERRLCKDVLESFARYTDRSAQAGESFLNF